jgi:DNA-directed RNA polymerase subunit RPC12/RpoP
MSDMKFGCPKCEQHLQCDEQLSGREIQCPKCHVLLRIPPVPGKTAQYVPESGMTWATFIPSGAGQSSQGLVRASKVLPPQSSG